MFVNSQQTIIAKIILISVLIFTLIYVVVEQFAPKEGEIGYCIEDESASLIFPIAAVIIPDFNASRSPIRKKHSSVFLNSGYRISVSENQPFSKHAVKSITVRNTDNIEIQYPSKQSFVKPEKKKLQRHKLFLADNRFTALNNRNNLQDETSQSAIWARSPRALYATNGPAKIFGNNNEFSEEDPFEPGGEEDPEDGYNDVPVGDGLLILLLFLMLYTLAKVNIHLLKLSMQKKLSDNENKIQKN